MSREERRAYKRLTKNLDPYAPPGNAARRAKVDRARVRQERARPTGPFQFVTARFLALGLGGAAAAGLIAFSVAWPNGMPLALYIGLAGAVVWGVLAVGVRLVQRRIAIGT
jgi:hypothetical protein